MHPAVFLDRDGTLIEDNGCIDKPSDVVFYEQAGEALKLLSRKYKLFIVTNQSWVSKGNLSLDDAVKVNRFIKDHFAKDGIELLEDYICPHQKDESCQCRKPGIFFAKKAENDFDIDLSRSYAIGDHLHDVEFGRAFGGQGIYVLTGHGRHELLELPADVSVAVDVLDAAKMVASENERLFCQPDIFANVSSCSESVIHKQVRSHISKTEYGLRCQDVTTSTELKGKKC